MDWASEYLLRRLIETLNKPLAAGVRHRNHPESDWFWGHACRPMNAEPMALYFFSWTTAGE